jgi:methylase of polypeptide subunit release factors
MTVKFDRGAAQTFLGDALQLIAKGAKEDALRHTLSAHLPRMFPEMPWWVKDHAAFAEKSAAFHKAGKSSHGFVDTLVGSTAIEYEKDITNPLIFRTGLKQVHDYCADLLNSGVPQDLIVGVLSDTVNWNAYRILTVKELSEVPGAKIYGGDHLVLDLIDTCNISSTGAKEASALGSFLQRHLGRLGARRLSANTLSSDLGFESRFSEPHLERLKTLVGTAFKGNPIYASLIQKLWSDFVSYLGGEAASGSFDRETYVNELYILTLAKLICANVLSGRALMSDDDELAAIMSGTYFQNRGLSNLVEYDYFGWLNSPPYVSDMLPVATAIQEDLLAYDFAAAPEEDLFGSLMAQLARRSQRLLLGQEWTPSWLAEPIVERVISQLPKDTYPRLIDMCCGSGAMIVETVRSVKNKLKSSGESAVSARAKLSEAITGFDIDPLAVMLAKISWVLAAREYLDPAEPVSIPIYHADSLFASTPLTKVVGGSGATHHQMLLDDQKVDLPAFLISPDRRALFDSILDRGYAVAMANARATKTSMSIQLVEKIAEEVVSDSGCPLTSSENALLVEFLKALLQALEELQRNNRNGIWAFVLRNSYRPGLASGKFNGLVSNPPWLALSKIASNPYTTALREKADAYAIKPPGPAHLHIEMATIFLLHAVDKYLISGAAIGCILPESIMSAHHHNPFRAGNYANGPTPVRLGVDEIWRVERGAFKNEAIVLFGTKGSLSTGDISGFDLTRTEKTSITLKRIVRGSRSAWTDNPALGEKNTGFFKPAHFRQGADVMPRTIVFHSLSPSGSGKSWNLSPISASSPEYYLTNDAKTHKKFKMTSFGVSDQFVFDVLISKHLTSFDISSGGKGILPIIRNYTGEWRCALPAEIAAAGPATNNALASMLGALGPSITPKDFFDRIDTNRGKLRNQVWGDGWIIFMGAGGANVCAAYTSSAILGPQRTIFDQTLYWTRNIPKPSRRSDTVPSVTALAPSVPFRMTSSTYPGSLANSLRRSLIGPRKRLEDLLQPPLHDRVSEPAPAVPRLQILDGGHVGIKCVEIGEDDVALDLPGSSTRRWSGSVYIARTAARMSSVLAESGIALPADLLILPRPSMPGRRPLDGISACASGRRSRPAAALIRRTISLVCSIIGAWSAPTGTSVARKAVMSAAWATG